MQSLPTCDDYDPYNANLDVRNSTNHVLQQKDAFQSLIKSLDSDRTGEAIVRNRVQADGNLLNVETIIFEATRSINNTIQQLNASRASLIALTKKLDVWNEGNDVMNRVIIKLG